MKKTLLSLLLIMSMTVAWGQSPIPLTIQDSTQVAYSKVYDGTNVANCIPACRLVGVLDGDTVDVQVSASYADPNVGTDKVVTLSFTLTGPQASLYVLDTTKTDTADITPRYLTVSGTTIDTTKVYTGANFCRVSNVGTVSNRIAGDTARLSAEAKYTNVNVGDSIPVFVTFSLSGGQAANYVAPDTLWLAASITPKTIDVIGYRVDSTKVYNGNTAAVLLLPDTNYPVSVIGVVDGDTVVANPVANYVDRNVDTHKVVIITYALSGAQGANYVAEDDTVYADITAKQLTVATDAEVRLVKEYDGTTRAFVTMQATLAGLFPADSVTSNTEARYDSPEAGSDKTITLSYTIEGPGMGNYIVPDDSVYSTEGRIIMPTVLDSASENSVFQYDFAAGFCQDNSADLNYTLRTGEPVSYTVDFYDSRFTSITQTIAAGSNTISFPIPADCPEGVYYFKVTFENVAGGQAVIDSIPFRVNLSTDYMVQIFDDVISIDNRENRFTTYQWYRNGVAISGATKPYYQENGGLNGNYHVVTNIGLPTEARTCDETYTTTSATKAVNVYPNPVTTTTTVKLQGFAEGSHMMQVYNAYGAVVYTATFNGNEYSLDMTVMPQGTYMVTVDGQSAKTIKY